MKKVLLLSLIIINPSFAEMMCNDATDYFAVYEPISYTCNPGQYLPANTLGCVPCPVGFTCNGGTFDFNPDYFQGIYLDITKISKTQINNICAANFPTTLHAIYEPNQYTCAPGYYLPANIDGCRKCPQDSYCAGGTYSFNKTTDQGISPCTNPTPFAPVGSSTCYPHILHIDDNIVYLKRTKITTPSLNIGMDDGVFYANMTTTPTHITPETNNYLKILVDNLVYYVYTTD